MELVPLHAAAMMNLVHGEIHARKYIRFLYSEDTLHIFHLQIRAVGYQLLFWTKNLNNLISM